MARYVIVQLLAVCLVVVSVRAQEADAPAPEEVDVLVDNFEGVDGEGRTLGLFKHHGTRYSHLHQHQPFFNPLGHLLGLFGGSPFQYAPQYYGHNGYGNGGGYNGGYGGGFGASPFIGGRPVNPGGAYRPGYPGYQQYPGGYNGGFYRDAATTKDLEEDTFIGGRPVNPSGYSGGFFPDAATTRELDQDTFRN